MPHEALFAAVASGDLRAVDQELDAVEAAAAAGQGPAIRELVDDAGITLAGCAALNRQMGSLDRLHARGVNLDAPSPGGLTPARIAASLGHGDVLRCLGRHGAELDARDPLGFRPAHAAAEKGHVDALMALAECHVDLNVRSDELGWAPVHLAALGDRDDALRTMGALSVDLNARTSVGEYSAAYLAAQMGNGAALRALGECGADLVAPTADGSAPVHVAAEGGHVDALRVLHASGVDMTAVNRSGDAPAHLAAAHGAVDAMFFLHGVGVDLSGSDAAGMAPLHVAAEDDQIPTLATLISRGVPMPGTWPPHLAEIGRQRVNQAAVAAAIAEFEGSANVKVKNMAYELMCPVSMAAFGTEGPNRPVRWTDGASSIVMSASAALNMLGVDTPKHPISGRVLTPEECLAVVESEAFAQGDAQRLAQVRAARDVMLAGGPEVGRLDRLMEAMPPEWQRVLQADQRRVAGADSGAGAPSAPERPAGPGGLRMLDFLTPARIRTSWSTTTAPCPTSSAPPARRARAIRSTN